MGGDRPKALVPMAGTPLLRRVIDAAERTPLINKPIIVIGYKADEVIDAIGPHYKTALQTEQRGTGHAVQCAKEHVAQNTEHIMVLYTDHPLLTSHTITKITQAHLAHGGPVTMATAHLPDFKDWRGAFSGFGRVLRDEGGNIVGIRERKDANDIEAAIQEVNPAYFCFRADWLWKHLDKITTNNAQHEYYLTDLIAIAAQDNEPIHGIAIEPHEALGVNTPTDLALAESIMVGYGYGQKDYSFDRNVVR